jgi:hypothetical protein
VAGVRRRGILFHLPGVFFLAAGARDGDGDGGGAKQLGPPPADPPGKPNDKPSIKASVVASIDLDLGLRIGRGFLEFI